ncbi:MAG TPA: DUF3445 domain-containing protein [Acidimicrobiales bacterium]|nr:DUF3445 domain-containing protein [Acidimicrobiales bacterium]
MAAPTWLDEIEPATSPPFVRMGTRGLGQNPWLLGGDDVPGQLEEKRHILAAHHHEVVAAIDGTEAAAAELLAAIQPQAQPEPEPGAADRHPIDAAGRLVAEDLCLLVERDGRWVLGAGSLSFPSHWRLRDKLGLPLAQVHDPVPDYSAELADKVDRFLDRLRPGRERGVWRRNWTVHHEPDLYAPEVPPPPDPPVTQDEAPHRLWLRSERQTLTRLPHTGAIVFTIRTQQVPLGAVAERPALRARLAEAVAAWPPHQVAYRGGEAIRRPLLAWLRSDTD